MSDDKAARRLASVIASDLQVYNPEQIKRGIENDTLFEELAEEIRNAEKNWNERLGEEYHGQFNLLRRSLVDQIFAGSKNIPSKIF